VSVIVCALQGQLEGLGEGERRPLGLPEAGLLGERLGLRPRVGETLGEAEREALTLLDGEPEQMGAPGQPQTETPAPTGTGAPLPSLTAAAICRRTGPPTPAAAETRRLPLFLTVSSASETLPSRTSEALVPRLLPGAPTTSSRDATLPQSTKTVPAPAKPGRSETRDWPGAKPPP
jgi:hypothetical protein